MKLQKKHLITAAIGLITISGAIAYYQYKKIIDYVIGFKNVKFNKITANDVNFDLFLNYTNKAKVGFEIESQKHDVYINNVFVTSLINNAPTHIAPDSVSVLGLNIQFNPQDALKRINKTFAAVLANPSAIMIKIESKMKVKIGFFKVNIPYVYEDTLKNMMA
jgi:LEA14-like dessication related protein